MNGKRGRCALCTINEEDIKTMKQFKKLASLLLAAVLAMTLLAGCGGRGGNVGTAVTEQSILKHINEARAAADVGLSPVKNDPTLANAAAKLLEAFSKKEKGSYRYGVGYKLTGNEVKDILKNVTGKDQPVRDYRANYSEDGAFFCIAPTEFTVGWEGDSRNDDFLLYRRANKVYDYGAYNGSASNIEYFASYFVVLKADMKVGIAFREIDGERFALVVYDASNPEM